MIKKYSLIFSIVLICILTVCITNDILVPFVFGFIFAYLFSPFVEFLEKLNISRTIGSMAVVSGMIIILLILVIALFPPLLQEAKALAILSKKLPILIHDSVLPYIESSLDKLGIKLNFGNMVDNARKAEYIGSIFNYSSLGFNKIYTTGVTFVSTVSLWLLTPIVAFYFLKDWNLIIRKTKKLIPLKYKDFCDDLFRDINKVLSGYIRGLFSLCIIMVIYYSIVLSIIGLPNGLIMGLISGMAVILPYVGAIISSLVAVSIAIVQFKSLNMALIVLSVYIFGQLVESNLIAPKLIGDKIKLNPLWLMFALLAGGNLLGISGIIISIPIAGILGVVIRHLLDYYYSSDAYNR